MDLRSLSGTQSDCAVCLCLRDACVCAFENFAKCEHCPSGSCVPGSTVPSHLSSDFGPEAACYWVLQELTVGSTGGRTLCEQDSPSGYSCHLEVVVLSIVAHMHVVWLSRHLPQSVRCSCCCLFNPISRDCLSNKDCLLLRWVAFLGRM